MGEVQLGQEDATNYSNGHQWWSTDQSWAIQLPQNPFTSVLMITESGDTSRKHKAKNIR